MAQDDRKLNRLEELKSKLFSKDYQTKIEHRESYSRPEIGEVNDSWETKDSAMSKNVEKFFGKTSRFKKFFVFALTFFALTLIYGSYVFLGGGNTVSNDNIDISILGNNFTDGGKPLPLVVGITNRNNASLDLVDLVMEYPKGSDINSPADVERDRVSLGTIPAGAVRNENLNPILFGEQGSVRTIKISIEYRVAGSSAIFVKEKDYQVNISSTPISLTVDGPTMVSPDQTITLNVKETLNATTASPRTLLRVTYPVGFQFTSATPAPSFGNNVWNLGDLAPGAEHDISITGKMVGVFDGEQKTFNISSGSQSTTDKSSISTIYNSISHTVTVSKAFLETNLFINGVPQTDYAIDSKTPINAQVRYANNLDSKVEGIKIEAKLTGNAINRSTINAQQGFYDSAHDVITWDSTSASSLAELNPGDSGSVNFSFDPLALFSSGTLLPDPTINIEVSISGTKAAEDTGPEEIANSTSATIRLISDVALDAKALYSSGAFTNTGPIPPKVGSATTYTIVWSLSNTANSISNAQVKSTLPPWMTFTNKISPASEDLTFNSSTKQIFWNTGRIPKGAGTANATPRQVAFQVSLTPSLSQVGTSPTLINQTVLTGHDDFANVDVKLTTAAVNTSLEGDPSFPAGGEKVIN